MSGTTAPHTPVMVAEVIAFLGERRTVLDMTLGTDGHAAALLDAGVGRVIGIDRDPAAIAIAGERLATYGERFVAIRARFSEVDVQGPVDGVLYDLGVSSMQLDDPARGFGYRADGPLDMRMDPDTESALDVVNGTPEQELADLIHEFGEERGARRVAAAIVRARTRSPIASTDELARIVAGALGARPGRAHPARRTFQALRIRVNDELEELRDSLPRAAGLLAPAGRLVVISYHSLEDRIVKRYLLSEPGLAILTKRPMQATPQEIARNPRARSAKLRAAERREAA